MTSFAGYEITTFNHGFLQLDGGAMFGSVPRPLWERIYPADEKHRIRLATRSLLLKSEKHTILFDVGCGEKWSEKERAIYGFEPALTEQPKLEYDAITDLVITHLHFDHAGGLTYFDLDGQLQLRYPNARIWIQSSNLQLARNPNLRERASYLESHVAPLADADLKEITGSAEILPNIFVHVSNGHTEGLQYVEIRDKESSIYYPSDLIPTSRHLPLPYHMGYDMCAATLLKEKQIFLERVLKEDSTIVFEHDSDVSAVKIEINTRGHYGVKETFEFR
ncbi:MAG: MBL fold metallo-hydrolase [Bdellovibrionales bacterium]|nr:MBL fold metallo-hydrolase [Bdellovibrionales bacterium]